MNTARMYNVIQPQFSELDIAILAAVNALIADGAETSEAIDAVSAEQHTGRNGRIALYEHFGLTH